MASFFTKLFGLEKIDPEKPRKYRVDYLDPQQQGKPQRKSIEITLPPASPGRVALEMVEKALGTKADASMALFAPILGGHYHAPVYSLFGKVEGGAITSKATRTIQPSGNWVMVHKPLIEQGILSSLRYESVIQPVSVRFLKEEKTYMLNLKEESHLALSHVLKEEGLWGLAPYLTFSITYASAPHLLSPKESILSQIPYIKPLELFFISFPSVEQIPQLNPKEFELTYNQLCASCLSYGPDPTLSSPDDKPKREQFRLEVDALKHQIEKGDFSKQQQSFVGSLLKNIGLDFNAKRDIIWQSFSGMTKYEAQIEYIKKWSSHPSFGFGIFSTPTPLFGNSVKLLATAEKILISRNNVPREYDWNKFLTAYSVVVYHEGGENSSGHWSIDYTIIKFTDCEEKIYFSGRKNELVVSYLWSCYGVRLLKGVQANPFVYPEDQDFCEVDPDQPTAPPVTDPYALPPQALWTQSIDYMAPHPDDQAPQSDLPPSYEAVTKHQ